MSFRLNSAVRNEVITASAPRDVLCDSLVTSGNVQVPKNRIARSYEVARSVRTLVKAAKDESAAQVLVHAANAQLQKFNFNYGSHKAKEVNVLKAPANGVLQLTVVANVSGHSQQADQFARDPNQGWTIRVQSPDGSSQTLSVKKPQNAGAVYAIAQDIEVPLPTKGTYIVQAWPTGSAGVPGYVEGREYRLHVGSENFYDPKPDKKKAAQMEADWNKQEQRRRANDSVAAREARAAGRPVPAPTPETPSPKTPFPFHEA